MPRVLESRKTRAEEVIARCRKLATFSEDADGTRRTFLSPPMHECHREVSSWLQVVGAEATIDAAGNLRALYKATDASAPRLLIGSHLDTIPNAGAYDGILGVVLGVALIEELEGRKLPFAIEVVGFSEEEGVRFGAPFIGSRALVGTLDDEFLNRRDAAGTTIREAIAQFGLNPTNIPQAVLDPKTLAFLEFHIEQGPVLESLQLPLAAVEAIVGMNRLQFGFFGRANHAGTTPMHLRHDALVAAAEWITTVERTAQNEPDLVATVGRIEAKPGATNVIPGEVCLALDIRHPLDAVRANSLQQLVGAAEEIAARRGVALKQTPLAEQNAVAMDKFLVAQIEQAIRKSGCEPHRMTSGAGHDTMILAEKIPSAMVFLRSPGGVSHHPSETVLAEDVARAIECGLHFLDQLAASPQFLKGTHRA